MDYNTQAISCPFPVGSIYITTDKMIPSGIWQGTFRVPFGKGRCLVCVDDQSSSESLKYAERELGSAVLPQQDITEGEEGGTVKVTTGASAYQPSITVYMRKRVLSQESGGWEKYNAFNITEEQASDQDLYGLNAIIDGTTQKAKQPDPYNP